MVPECMAMVKTVSVLKQFPLSQVKPIFALCVTLPRELPPMVLRASMEEHLGGPPGAQPGRHTAPRHLAAVPQ